MAYLTTMRNRARRPWTARNLSIASSASRRLGTPITSVIHPLPLWRSTENQFVVISNNPMRD
jgi:hypothetical protein